MIYDEHPPYLLCLRDLGTAAESFPNDFTRMKVTFSVLIAGLLAGGANAGALHHREHYEEKFYSWMLKHKIHIPAGQEFVRRLEIFIENRYVEDDHLLATCGSRYTGFASKWWPSGSVVVSMTPLPFSLFDNSDFIEKHNKGNHTYRLGHNQFSHLTYDEFKQVVSGLSIYFYGGVCLP